MATQGPSLPVTGTTVSSGSPSPTYDWTNPGNVGATGSSYATASSDVSFDTNYLSGTNYGITIPTGATINGIVLNIDRFASLSTSQDFTVKLVKAGTIVGTNKATATAWPTTVGTATYGSTSDLWGTTWTSSDVNNSAFGFVINPTQTASGSHSYSVNNARLTVTYTPSVNGTITGISTLTGVQSITL